MKQRLLLGIVLMGISSLVVSGEKILSTSLPFSQWEAETHGKFGIAATNTANNQQIQYRANELFPMGCTSKVIGVAAILKKSLKEPLLLQKRIHYQKKDLTNWVPVTQNHLTDGMTIAELSAAAISYSDNTAMNLLTKELGGPQELNAFARSIDDKHFKLDHWWPAEALASPGSGKDATTPVAMEKSLQKLVFGDVLAVPQRKMLVTWLKENVTGNARIRAGVPKGWVVGDKTGTGFNYGITNDIAVIWPPKCAPIILTVYYSNNAKNAPKHDAIIAAVTRKILNQFSSSDPCLKQQLAEQ